MNDLKGALELLPFCSKDTFPILKSAIFKRGQLQCRVVSDSMEPLIPVGQTVEIEPVTETESLRRFDIVVFLHPDANQKSLFCHFLWNHGFDQTNPTIETRSLARGLPRDLPIPTSLILGKVSSVKISLLWKLRILLRLAVRL